MLQTCSSCGAVLSMPADRCQACGVLFTIDSDASGASSVADVSVSDTTPPTPGPASADEESRLDGLLAQIAGQSHFEDRYDIRRRIAAGGMGNIFRAFDRILRREVAIKMMHEGMKSAGAALRGQFLKEAHVGGRLLHPHILSIFDLGVNRSGQMYFTMRLVDGASLEACLEALDKAAATRLVAYPLRKIVEAFLRACHGVDYAHQNGVIHLDIKPDNVLVSGFNEVFVIDWGLARVDAIDDTERLVDLYRHRYGQDDALEATGAFENRVVGTAPYMAPEQMVGEVEAFDASTDVFGLGGILYFALYNQHPNRGEDFAAMRAARNVPRKRGKLRPGILPRGQRVSREARVAVDMLEEICLKALAPDKADRYPDVEKMIIELNDWLTNTPGPPLGF
jgi:serine/threonine protein kinase